MKARLQQLGARRRLLVMFGLAVVVVAVAVPVAWALVAPTVVVPNIFVVEFNGTNVHATSYSIEGVPNGGPTGGQRYRVVVSAPDSSDLAFLTAFRNGTIADVRIVLFTSTATVVVTYDFLNVAVASYQQNGSAGTTGLGQQQLAFTSTSLKVS